MIEVGRKLNNECVGLLSAHEIALSMDGVNSNMECLRFRLDEYFKALTNFEAKFKGEK